MQLEQLVLFESGEMLFSSVKSKNCVCISTEHDVFIRILNTRSWAILYDEKKNIDVRPVEFCNLSVFKNGNSHVVLAFNVLSSHLFAWRDGFLLEAFFNALRLLIADHLMHSVTLKSVHIGALFSRWVFISDFSFFYYKCITTNVNEIAFLEERSLNLIAPSDCVIDF